MNHLERRITPIYWIDFQSDISFSVSFNGIEFDIFIWRGVVSLDRIKPNTWEWKWTKYYLIVSWNHSTSGAYIIITLAIIDILRLSLSEEFCPYKTFVYKYHENVNMYKYYGSESQVWIHHWFWSKLTWDKVALLDESGTIDLLVQLLEMVSDQCKYWFIYRKIHMVLDLYAHAFWLENKNVKFVNLVIILEVLFKKDNSEDLWWIVTTRVAKFIASDRKERKKREWVLKWQWWISGIRNDIVHGSMSVTNLETNLKILDWLVQDLTKRFLLIKNKFCNIKRADFFEILEEDYKNKIIKYKLWKK